MHLDLSLRKTQVSDLPTLFFIQQDEEANFMAAFTAEDPSDEDAYMKKWIRLLNDEKVNCHTVLSGSEIVGSVAKYVMDGQNEITYWIDRKHWGLGVASYAVKMFLEIETSRPMNARVAVDNRGSVRVLEKCGFKRKGVETGYANARRQKIEEYVYLLE
ncbi:MAG: GNAT family N-acetyltransferase [Flavobacteriales bacterium]|nr:GNAT family N-acetyltransferase [Flavobacteriales bacterium]